MSRVTNVVIIGGGPGGYEAALVAAQLGAEVTLVERTGMGGAAVLSDCVPSKTLIATAEVMTMIENSAELGLKIFSGTDENVASSVHVDLAALNQRHTTGSGQIIDVSMAETMLAATEWTSRPTR